MIAWPHLGVAVRCARRTAPRTSQVQRLIQDVESHGKKIGEVKDAITFVKGACWVIGGGIVLGGAIIGLVLSGKVSITFH